MRHFHCWDRTILQRKSNDDDDDDIIPRCVRKSTEFFSMRARNDKCLVQLAMRNDLRHCICISSLNGVCLYARVGMLLTAKIPRDVFMLCCTKHLSNDKNRHGESARSGERVRSQSCQIDKCHFIDYCNSFFTQMEFVN